MSPPANMRPAPTPTDPPRAEARPEADPEMSATRRPARAGASRTHVHAEVKEARARLSQGTTLKPEFEYELLAIFARNERQAMITIPTLAVISLFALLFWAPQQVQALGWCGLVIATKLFMTVACRRFLATPRQDVHVETWRRRLTYIELISGVSWAGMALVAANTSDTAAHVFVLAALIVLLAIRMTFAHTVMPILYVGTVPMACAVFVRLMMQGDLFHVAMAFMAVGLQVYFIVLAKDLYATDLNLLVTRAVSDNLLFEKEQHRHIADEARHRAEAANVAKSRFLATMSHELRTPLNAILGFSEVMQEQLLGPIDNPQYREYVTSIHDSGRHLLHLINEILDLSRIEAGRYELNEEAVRLEDILDDCARLLKIKADGKGLTLDQDVPPTVPQLWVDERAVRQIVLNLLSNAVKFTPRGGRVSMIVSLAADGGVSLNVRDTGPGIPKDEIPKVLQAFGQGSLAHQTAEGGTGLGLPIVQSLMALHGGRFELLSELRKGTQAIVHFPATRVLQPVRPLQKLGGEKHRKDIRWLVRRPKAKSTGIDGPPRSPRLPLDLGKTPKAG